MSFWKSLSPKDKTTLSYFAYTMGYGFIRKTCQLYDAKIVVDRYKEEERQVPVLVADKVWITFLHAGTAVYFWPWYLCKDISSVEMRLRGLNPEDYHVSTKKTHVGDWMF